jgi:hypothetical protein
MTKRENLETPTISKNWEIDIHEFVQTSHLFDDIRSRAEHEMVGITEHDLRLHLCNSLSCDSLNRRGSTDRHKNGRLNNSMWSRESTSTSESVSRGDFEGEHYT